MSSNDLFWRFGQRFFDVDYQRWDEPLEQDIADGKLEALVEEAIATSRIIFSPQAKEDIVTLKVSDRATELNHQLGDVAQSLDQLHESGSRDRGLTSKRLQLPFQWVPKTAASARSRSFQQPIIYR